MTASGSAAAPRRFSRAGERRRIAFRALGVQAVWNYDTLQAVGFAWSLLPGLERIYPDRAERAGRVLAHLDLINANPYLSTLGLGVALRLEQEVARDPAIAGPRQARLLKALNGPLGALGDELFWGAWRPALGLTAALFALATMSVWPALIFLVAFNGLAQSVRFGGVRAGFAGGAGIARVLRDPFWRRATGRARTLGAVAAGAAFGAGLVWAGTAAGDLGWRDADGAWAWASAAAFALSVFLLVLGARGGRGERPLVPVLALLVLLAACSALVQAGGGG
ncbi:MAG: PTS system mannose/fructose/sorbose family transporter subunit IID [Gemmatimonadota bacterium]